MVAKNNSVARVRGPRSAARRQHILATTRDLFVKRGFHQTGMAQIASSSGIAVGQIYRDFANKEAIIAAICEADLAEWLEEETLETAVAVGDREGILAWIERIAIDEPSHENRRMMCEFVATVGCNPIIAEINRKADVRLRTSLGAALASLAPGASPQDRRSEEHTSELQSLMRISYAVFCLKKKKQRPRNKKTHTDYSYQIKTYNVAYPRRLTT